MINDVNTTTPTPPPAVCLGARLQLARENMRLDTKEAAAQLRLNEKFIIMMEKENFPHDLPTTFIRGYIRAYGKLLDIPQHEIDDALQPIQPIEKPEPSLMLKKPVPLMTKNYFMPIFTTLVIITLLSLVVAWWYKHTIAQRQMHIETIKSAVDTVEIKPLPVIQAQPTINIKAPFTIDKGPFKITNPAEAQQAIQLKNSDPQNDQDENDDEENN